MKRDPRLHRCGERRGERRLGQGAATRRARSRSAQTLRLYRLLGLKPRMRRLADGFVQLERNARAAQAAWAKQLALIAERVCADNQAQWRDDLGLRGEAYVKVGWDDVLQQPTHERIEPSEIELRVRRDDLLGAWPYGPEDLA